MVASSSSCFVAHAGAPPHITATWEFAVLVILEACAAATGFAVSLTTFVTGQTHKLCQCQQSVYGRAIIWLELCCHADQHHLARISLSAPELYVCLSTSLPVCLPISIARLLQSLSLSDPWPLFSPI
jgi:hypothetical protein